MNENEATALRAYLQKGGFVIVDDFKVRGEGVPGQRRLGDVRREHEARAARARGS